MIIHLFGHGFQDGGTPKHINELKSLFPSVPHIFSNVFQLESIYNENKENVKMIHVHAAVLPGYKNIELNFVDLLERIRDSVRILWTVHDYQWLLPSNPNPTMEDFRLSIPFVHPLIKKLFEVSHTVLFPTKRLLSNYKLFYPTLPLLKCVVTPHCDVVVPKVSPIARFISNRPIRIAFIGYFAYIKGNQLFDRLASTFFSYKGHTIEYHVFGEVHQNSPHINQLKLHGKYNDNDLVSILEKNEIDVVCHLSIAEETYCYALTRTLQSQLPIFYIKRGALSERLDNQNELYVGFKYGYEMIPKLSSLLDLIIEVPIRERNCDTISNELTKTNWYQKYYIF
jgi:hypothetical protein